MPMHTKDGMGRLQIENTLAVLGDDRRYEWLASLSFGALCDLINAVCMLGWNAVDAR